PQPPHRAAIGREETTCEVSGIEDTVSPRECPAKKTKTGSWVYITDKKSGVTGWVSGTYVYRTVYMCLD
ncbi:hypothetical protein AB0K57_33870, partial [Streptomyces halstedii]